jgi:TatA/E family protein of Tat protein translocase
MTMGEFSLTHLLVLALILLVFFGPSRLPQLGSSIGKAIRGFKKGLSEEDDSRDVSKLSHEDKKDFTNTAKKDKHDVE